MKTASLLSTLLALATLTLAGCGGATEAPEHVYQSQCDGHAKHYHQHCKAFPYVAGDEAYGVPASCKETPFLLDDAGSPVFRSNGREGCIGIEQGITCCPEAGKDMTVPNLAH